MGNFRMRLVAAFVLLAGTIALGDEPKVVELPEPISHFHLGGGGRYVVCQLPKAQVLAIVDLVEGKIAKELPLPTEDARFVAGSSSLVIVQPAQGLVQVYSFSSFTRTGIGKLPAGGPIKHLRMGFASTGPLWVWSPGKEIYAVDTTNLKPIALRGVKRNGDENHGYDIRVSPDGKSLTTWHGGLGPTGFELSRLQGTTLVDAGSQGGYSHNGRYFQPNADGSLMLCHVSSGFVLSGDLKERQCDLLKECWPIVTADPRYFLGIKAFDERRIKGRNAPPPTIRVQVFASSNMQPIYTMDGVELNTPSQEPSVIFLPKEKLLAVVPEKRDRIVIRELDLTKLASGGGTKLAVTSVPPTSAAPGSNFEYTIEAIPDTGLTFKLEAGPTGMKVSPQGKVTWKVPVNPQEKTESVIISVRDAKKNEVLHTFDLALVRGGTTASNTPRPPEKTPGKTANVPEKTPPTSPDTPAEPKDTGKFAKAGADRLEVPDGEIRVTPVAGKRWLVLAGNQLAIVGGDGVTLEKTVKLPDAYVAIGERDNYYVAIKSKPMSIDIIDRQSLKVLRTRKLPYMEMRDLQLHPTLPISYVAFKAAAKIPRYRFVVFDERTTEADESEDFLGTWMAIDPRGRFLVTAYKDIYQRGVDVIANPDRWHLVPSYGNIDWVIRYKLDAKGMPALAELKTEAGGNGHGIRLSPDGARVSYLSFTGTPMYTGNLTGWVATDLKKLPASYEMKDRAAAMDLDFHPMLPLAVAPAPQGALVFQRDTGENEDRVAAPAGALSDAKPTRAWFSPDGKQVVLLVMVNQVNHLQKLPLKLSKEEEAIIQKSPDPRREPPAKADPTKLKV